MAGQEEKLEFYSTLLGCSDCEYLHRYLTYASAPVLAGAKPAELVSLKHKGCRRLWNIHKDCLCASFALCCWELEKSNRALSILFYDREKLFQSLRSSKAQSVLKKAGYNTKVGLEGLLKQLTSRFSRKMFPHEIGIFLGYPPQDVSDFIQHKGKSYRMCGHWKVYHDIEGALRTFQQIDRAKSKALKLLNRQVPFQDSINMIKTI